jgi:hypothetical protein
MNGSMARYDRRKGVALLLATMAVVSAAGGCTSDAPAGASTGEADAAHEETGGAHDGAEIERDAAAEQEPDADASVDDDRSATPDAEGGEDRAERPDVIVDSPNDAPFFKGCGAEGTIAERIADCRRSTCVAVVDGGRRIVDCRQSFDYEWKLVAEKLVVNTTYRQVWLDAASGLVWSDDSMLGGDQPTLGAACEDPEQLLEPKVHLPIAFRLPTKDEMESAMAHGIASVWPFFDDVLWWTSTPYGADEVWYAALGLLGHRPKTDRDEYFRARCVSFILEQD